jgi:predicted dehydrogenase
MNIVICGCGNVSEKYILGLKAIPNVKIYGFCDVDVTRAEKAALQNGSTTYQSIHDVLSDPSVELVINLTPPDQHYDVNKRILMAGKHAFSEKPVAMTLQEAIELQNIAKQHNVLMMAAPDTFICEPFQRAKAILTNGDLGLITSFSAAMVGPGHELWHPQPEYYYRKGAGPLWDMGPYFLTQLTHLLGPAHSVIATSRMPRAVRSYTNTQGEKRDINVEVMTHYDVLLEMQSGVTGTFTVSYDVPADRRPYFDVFGTLGALRLENPDEYRGNITFSNAAGHTDTIACPENRLPPRARGAGLIDMFTQLAKGNDPLTSGPLAGHVIELMQAIDTSAQTKQWVTVGRSL